jgi:hypothetical protein
MDDWRKQISIAHLVKQRVAQLDVLGLWSHHLPEIAASPEEIAQTELVLGEPLDEKFRRFLCFANGWQNFYHSVDLFGTKDLFNGPRNKRAQEILQTLEPLDRICGAMRTDVMPIAVSQNSIDVFVIGRHGVPMSGTVIWLAGQEIDRYSDFDEFFLAMVDYNRDDATALERQS